MFIDDFNGNGWDGYTEECLDELEQDILKEFQSLFEGGSSYYTLNALSIREVDRKINDFDEHEVIVFEIFYSYSTAEPDSKKNKEVVINIDTHETSFPDDFRSYIVEEIKEDVLFDNKEEKKYN